MLKIIDITFHANPEYNNTSALLTAQATSLIYINPLRKLANIDVVKHYTNQIDIHAKPGFHFFPASNRFGYFSLRTMQYIKKAKPDIIFVRGLIFPVQVIFLRLWLGRRPGILVWHHADQPFKQPKRMLQRIADNCINGYLFSAIGNAKTWLSSGIIKDRQKIFELPATLTQFTKLDRVTSRQKTGMPPGHNFLWVGRLNENKDPLTVLDAFEQLLKAGHAATLHLVFQTEELLIPVKEKIAGDPLLRDNVILQGRIPYNEIPLWFSAADHFISSSYSEGGSSAILEAMACGCIPIVSNIPASMKAIGNGTYGLFFSPGDADSLFERLLQTTGDHRSPSSREVRDHYKRSFSPEAVALSLFSICSKLTSTTRLH